MESDRLILPDLYFMWYKRKLVFIKKEYPGSDIPTLRVTGTINKIHRILFYPPRFGWDDASYTIDLTDAVLNDLHDKTKLFKYTYRPEYTIDLKERKIDLHTGPTYDLTPGDELIIRVNENGINKTHNPVIFKGFEYNDGKLLFSYVDHGPKSQRGTYQPMLLLTVPFSQVVTYKILKHRR